MRFKRRRGAVTADLDAGEAGLLAALAEDLLGLLGDGDQADEDPLAAMVGLSSGPVAVPDDPALARLLPNAYADDDHAAVVIHETGSRPDGAAIAVDEVHILRLRDGKVLDLWDLPEDIQAHDAFFSGT